MKDNLLYNIIIISFLTNTVCIKYLISYKGVLLMNIKKYIAG